MKLMDENLEENIELDDNNDNNKNNFIMKITLTKLRIIIIEKISQMINKQK